MLPSILKLESTSVISNAILEIQEFPKVVLYEGTADMILRNYIRNMITALAVAEALEQTKDMGAINSDEIVERTRELKSILKEEL